MLACVYVSVCVRVSVSVSLSVCLRLCVCLHESLKNLRALILCLVVFRNALSKSTV
jgi:hypothetical protein